MAKKEHLAILKNARVAGWNKWRKANPEVVANLRDAELRNATIGGADLIGADLTGADLTEAILTGADLSGAALNGSDLIRANLNRANLSGADLSGADLTKAGLHRAVLAEANLREADLTGADLSGADLSGADLGGVDLTEADLSGADLTRANLGGVSLKRTLLDEADVSESRTYATLFADVDLSQVKGLDSVDQAGPSTIGIDTVYASQAKMPESFLRGAGVGDEFISLIRGIAGAVQFYSCFISYSSKDQSFAERLYADLQMKGVRCWFAPHDVQGGKKLHEQIDEAIHVHERLLLILSPHSIRSEWVKTEIAKARKREIKEQRHMLFPVSVQISFKELQDWECFDADTGKDSAREIREFYIPDFTGWESLARYQEEFEKLVRDLKKRERTAGTA